MMVLSSNFSKRVFIALLFLIPISKLTAQTSTVALREFVLFGKEGVNIAGATVESGSVGSNTYVKTTSGPSISGNIHSLGTISLSNNTTVKGKITAGPVNPPASFSGITFQGGNSGLYTRRIDVNGNIDMGSGVILNGIVTQPPGASFVGPTLPSGQYVIGTPTIPSLPVIAVPSLPSFTGNQNVINTATLLPNAQRKDVILNGGKTLTFNGVGKYYLNSINNSGSNTLEFNFGTNSNPADLIEVYVKTTVALGKSTVSITGSGDPSRVVIRVWGTGTSFGISNGNAGGIQWQGTVYAFNGNIDLSSGGNATKVIGALYSNKVIFMGSTIQVIHAALDPCGLNADAGYDQFLQDCPGSTATLTGSAKTGSQLSYLWTAEDGGVLPTGTPNNQLTLQGITTPGTYVLTVSQNGGGCPSEYSTASDFALVTSVPCVEGVMDPPPGGKLEEPFDKTTTDLDVLYNANGIVDPSTNVTYQIRTIGGAGYVLIDVITRTGFTNSVYSYLTGTYGLQDTIYNGPTNLIITGWFPIMNLLSFNSDPFFLDKVSYVRPVYPAIYKNVTGLAGGDIAMGSSYSRGGYKLTGAGQKIGILSDSYNNKGGAITDVENRDLPGDAASPLPIINPINVTVLKDYPYGSGTDEGRSMMQIVYDVAPMAHLYFRTAFLTAGDFRLGMQELVAQGCSTLVDDVSFITEPYFVDGVIAQGVKEAVAQGVHYVTAAGNYATKSYEGAFVPATGTPVPFGIQGVAHNFGNSIFQTATVKALPAKPGVYTIGLQWADDYSSLGALGANVDLDLYAINQANEVIGFNRISINADPMEIMSFVVNPHPTQEVTTQVRLMVVCDGTPPPGLYFKFIVFRGDFTFVNPGAGANAGTIVGQANVPEAHTIGAVRYTTPTIIEPFTSRGGVRYNGSASQKPDYVAPDGVNTSVDMGSLVDPEGDGIKNFFGTSASAPHVAGGIALLMEAKDKFQDSTISPQNMKVFIRKNAVDIGAAGFDYESGWGQVRIDRAIASIANPTPVIEGVQYPNPLPPGATSQNVIIVGRFFIPTTTFRLNGVLLTSTVVNDSTVNLTLPVFADKRGLIANNPSIALVPNSDGGNSNTWYFNADNKFLVTISVDDKHKKFLGEFPAYTHKVFKRLNGVTTEVTDPAEKLMFGVTNITYLTNATLGSNASVSPFFIAPVIPVADTAGKFELYDYAIDPGALFVDPLNVQVKPKNKNIVYGAYIGEIDFEYQILDVLAPANMELAMAYLEMSHKSSVSSNAFALLDDLDFLNAADQEALRISLGLPAGATTEAIRLAFANALATQNLAFMVSLKTVLSARAFDIVNNKMVAAANPNAAQLSVVDLNKTSFLNFLANNNNIDISLYPALSASGTTNRGIVSTSAFIGAEVNNIPLKNAGYAQTLLSVNQVNGENELVSKMPIYNNKIVHQLHATTYNGTSAAFPSVNIVHYIYAMGLVQADNTGNYVTVPQGQPVILSDGTIVTNYLDPANTSVMSMKQLLDVNGVPLQIAVEQKIALSGGILSIKNINGVLQYVDVNGAVVNPNSITNISTLVADLNAVALRAPYSSELSVAPDGTYSLSGVPLALNRIVMAHDPISSGGLGLMVSSGGLGLMVGSGAGGLGLLVSSGGLGLLVSSGGLGLLVSSGGLGLLVSSGGLGLLVSSGGLGLLVSSGGLGLLVSSGGLGLLVSSGGLGLIVTSSGSTNGLANNTPVIFSQNEVDNNGFIGPNIGINLVTSLSVGENYIIGGAFVNSNLNVTNVAGNLNVTKAAPTVTVVPGGPYTYDGTAKSATGSATGVNGEALNPPVTFKYSGVSPTVYPESTSAPVNAGTYSVKAVFAGNGLYAAGESASAQMVINKANANIVVTPYSVTYDGLAHTSSGSATGVEAPTPVNLSSLLVLTGTTHTNAGTYNGDAWSFTGNGNYNATSGTVNNSIGKANSTVSITGGTFNEDGSSKPATGFAYGVGGISDMLSPAITFVYTGTGSTTYPANATAPSLPGTYSVTGTFAGNSNYNGSTGQTTITIIQTCPTLTHDQFNSFTDANPATGQNAPTTTMWVQVKIKINGQLMNVGDYIDYGGGIVYFNGIKTDAGNNSSYPIQAGRITAGPSSTVTTTSFNSALNRWETVVPVNLNTTSDIFISGAIVNSQSGFKKLKNTPSYTYMTGSFTSNVNYSSRWLYSMAAYQVPGNGFTIASLTPSGSVISINTQPYGSGTPFPHTAYVVAGGTGSGNGNYTGNTSSLDNFTACTSASSSLVLTRQITPQEEKAEPQIRLAPNPSRDNVTITYVPAISGKTTVKLFQMNGVEITGIYEGLTEAGEKYNWNLKTGKYPAGVYLVRLINNGVITTRKLVIVN
jgi:hypothetical protein